MLAPPSVEQPVPAGIDRGKSGHSLAAVTTEHPTPQEAAQALQEIRARQRGVVRRGDDPDRALAGLLGAHQP